MDNAAAETGQRGPELGECVAEHELQGFPPGSGLQVALTPQDSQCHRILCLTSI